jgi:hypothetical protein
MNAPLPILDIEATTKVSKYTITMNISGDATRKIDTVLTSLRSWVRLTSFPFSPPANAEDAGAGRRIAEEQALTWQANWEPQSPTRPAALGLSQVRIEPNLFPPKQSQLPV